MSDARIRAMRRHLVWRAIIRRIHPQRDHAQIDVGQRCQMATNSRRE
jgi:hypothetical protein